MKVEQIETNKLRKQGQPEAYIDGYWDGCLSGKEAGNNPAYRFTKDARRFVNDRLYNAGWTDGYAYCLRFERGY